MYSLITFLIIFVITLMINNSEISPNKLLNKLTTKFKNNNLIIIVYIFTVIIIYIVMCNISIFKDNMANKDIISNLDFLISLFLLSTQVALILDVFIMIPIQKKHEKNVIKKYEKAAGIQSFEYYRELVKSVSPAILAYCYNNKVSTEDAIVSTILDLERKNIIKLSDNKIEVIDNNYKLKEHEKFAIYEYKSNNYKSIKIKNKIFFDKIKLDMENMNYLSNKYDEMNILEILNFFLLFTIFYGIAFFITASISKNIDLFIIIMICVTYFLSFASVIIYNNIKEKINPFVKSKEAFEITAKLNGLKNYLKDFTSISDESIDKIKLYDEYIIYAIIFNLKGNLNNECKEIYNNIKKISN